MSRICLRELVEVRGGGTPRRTNPDFYGGSIPWVTPKDMKRPIIGESSVQLTQAGVDNSPARVIEPGSVLVVVRSGVLKHTLPVALTSAPVTLNQDMKALTPREGVDASYLARFIKAMEPQVLSWVRATTADNFPVERLLDLPVRLPSLAEQRRIAAILDQADVLRAKRQQARAQLDALTQSIFHDMFGEPMHGRQNWPRVRLGEIARIIRGASPRPAGDPRYFGGHIPWLKISDLTAAPGRVVTNIKEGVTAAGRDKSVLLPAQTLVLSNSATVGIPKIITPEACIHDGFLAFLDLDSHVNQTWLYGALLASRRRLVALAPEGTQKNLNGPIVKNVEIALPPMALQSTYATRLAAVEWLHRMTGDTQEELEKLFMSLHFAAFAERSDARGWPVAPAQKANTMVPD